MIPFNRPSLMGTERAHLEEVLERRVFSGDGPFCRRSEKLLEETTGCRRVLVTTSCTHALEMSAMLLDIAPGDEVIVPSFTFVSTLNAFVLRGAKPVFADVRADTMNLDERAVERLVTTRTKAVIPVHYAGVGCDMDALSAICAPKQIAIVEDNAHGLYGKYRGRQLGTFGVMATQSFHETKNFSCGEGGALLVNDESFTERAEVVREKGTNRSRFFRGQVDKYTWVDVGSSYVLSDLLAAVLLGQLEARTKIQAARAAIWARYARELGGWAAAANVQLPFVPEHCEQSFHMFYLVMPDLAQRTAFIAHLAAKDIKAAFHYQALHLSPMGERFGGRPGDCPVTEKLGDCLVRLPFYNELTEREQGEVIDAVTSFRA